MIFAQLTTFNLYFQMEVTKSISHLAIIPSYPSATPVWEPLLSVHALASFEVNRHAFYWLLFV